MPDKSAVEPSGTLTRGSIARRMLIATAIWSAAVLLVAGWSLVALSRSEQDRQLDSMIDETMRTLANAVQIDPTTRLLVTEDEAPASGGEAQPRFPDETRFTNGFSGFYWAALQLNDENRISDGRWSESFVNALPEPSAEAIATALARPSEVVYRDAIGPNTFDPEADPAQPPAPGSAVAPPVEATVEPIRLGLRALTIERTIVIGTDPATGREITETVSGLYPVILYVGINRTEANEAVGRFTLQLAVALAVLAVGLVIGIVVLIRYGLRPLHAIQNNLGDVRAGRRDDLGGEYPAELAPLVTEINTLLSHNRKVVERARTHVGNLAHALKTPIAVLKNEAKGTDKLSDLVRRQTDAMSSNVSHYLKRAQAAAQAEVLGARTEVREPIEGIARMFERLHRDKGIAIDVDVDPKAIFRGERGDFDDLIGNLLENAAKWCKSRVNVTVTRNDDGLRLVVDDDGPGLPPEHRAKALERGKRLDESEPGTGLGLSIVTELADIYGGRLFLEDSPLGGLRARLELPAAPL